MRTRIAGALLVAALAQPATAQGLLDNVTNEDIGRVVGGVGGALLGSQFGGGSGRLVGAAIGGVAGVMLGGEIGRRLDAPQSAGVTQASQQALDSGQPVSWTSSDGAVSTDARVVETQWRPAPQGPSPLGVVATVPAIELIGAPYAARSNSNLRGGPGTDYAVMDTLRAGETVQVVGKVVGQDWLMVSRDGVGRGFVFANLLSPAPAAAAGGVRTASTDQMAGVRECSVLEQTVRTRDGASETMRARACRDANGQWVLM
jgi:surface antigen